MVIRPLGMKNVSGNTFVRTKNFRYKNRVKNSESTISPPTIQTSSLLTKCSEIENPKRTKKKVRTRNDDSAVRECRVSRIDSTSFSGKYRVNEGNLMLSQLLIISPN